MNALANNASHLRGQDAYDHAEDPRYADDAREDAIEAEADRIWRDPDDLQSALEYHGIKLGSEACRGLSASVRNPGIVPGYILALCDDLDPLVKRYVVEAA